MPPVLRSVACRTSCRHQYHFLYQSTDTPFHSKTPGRHLTAAPCRLHRQMSSGVCSLLNRPGDLLFHFQHIICQFLHPLIIHPAHRSGNTERIFRASLIVRHARRNTSDTQLILLIVQSVSLFPNLLQSLQVLITVYDRMRCTAMVFPTPEQYRGILLPTLETIRTEF